MKDGRIESIIQVITVQLLPNLLEPQQILRMFLLVTRPASLPPHILPLGIPLANPPLSDLHQAYLPLVTLAPGNPLLVIPPLVTLPLVTPLLSIPLPVIPPQVTPPPITPPPITLPPVTPPPVIPLVILPNLPQATPLLATLPLATLRLLLECHQPP